MQPSFAVESFLLRRKRESGDGGDGNDADCCFDWNRGEIMGKTKGHEKKT